MRSLTVILAADDTPTTILALAALATSIPAAAQTAAGLKKITNNVLWFKIYPESGNDVDALNGPARIGFDASVSRVVATQHGTPLLPALAVDFLPGGGGCATYQFGATYISGKTGDQFQIHYDTL